MLHNDPYGIRYLRAIFIVACFGIGIWLGTLLTNPVQPVPTIPSDALLPCPTEDSTHCYWDASEQGNGMGSDFVAP